MWNIKVLEQHLPTDNNRISGSTTSLWLASFGLFACLHFGPCPLFLYFSLSWVLSFHKVWQGFIINKLATTNTRSK
jgi:hypothetical protein